MSATDIITAFGAILAAITILVTLVLYRLDQRREQASQTREALQDIIGYCGRFLHPLTEEAPYPILYTASAITKEFCSRMGESPKGKDVFALLNKDKKDLLLSICVDGWVASTQIIHMMELIEELEHKASSHYLRGKLHLICQASFLLAGIVAKGCSPINFYAILSELHPKSCENSEVEVILNEITIELQNAVCQKFKEKFRDPIILCLSFIQSASVSFIKLQDRKLIYLARRPEPLDSGKTDSKSSLARRPESLDSDKTDLKSSMEDLILRIKKEALLSNHLKQVREVLSCLEQEMDLAKYQDLCHRIEVLANACVVIDETIPNSVQRQIMEEPVS